MPLMVKILQGAHGGRKGQRVSMPLTVKSLWWARGTEGDDSTDEKSQFYFFHI